ncbi:MAG: right-handed parallel beta-helix repeat-containing protein, partial [Lysobacterales bacterium]
MASLFAAVVTVPVSAATFTVTSTADSTASGTLRWAIGQANGVAGADSIHFNIAGGGVKSIALLSPLPDIGTTMTLDGTTQPGYAGTPLIELNGSGAGAGANGLNVASANNLIRGLAINRFGGRGVSITSLAGGTTVSGCHVGTDAAGTAALANAGTGIFIAGSPSNTVGPGNVVSGNLVDGVRIDAAAATGNVVKGNRIGTNLAGTAALPQTFNGVVISGASNNLIGGSGSADGNVISGNMRNGVAISGGGSGNRLERNHIGVAADGNTALGNGWDGVLVVDSPGNAIGGGVAGTYNVISANGGDGVELRGDATDNCVVQRNLIGLDV